MTYRENAKPEFISELKKLNQSFEIAQHLLLEKELNGLEERIKAVAQSGQTFFSIRIRREDIEKYGFMWRKIRLLNEAKCYYNKFIELGFAPVIDVSYPSLCITW